MRKTIKKIVLVVLVFLLYVAFGAVLPFVNQPEVTTQTQEKVQQTTLTLETISGERARVIDDNGEALDERIRLISQAKDSIILSTFEMRTDQSGKDMLSALIDAAQRGVDVKMIIDGVAHMTRMIDNDDFMALSTLENAQIKIYNPLTFIKPWQLMGRMHDKYLIVDDYAYILGGRNTYDYFLGDHGGYKNYDWDVLVYQQEKDSSHSLYQLLDYFDQIWNLPICQLYHDETIVDFHVLASRQILLDRYDQMKREKPERFININYQEYTLPTHHIELIHNPIDENIKEPIVYYTLTQLMLQAKKEVKFHTPYIICNDWMLERIKQVTHQVPQVTMMTNSVANNGNPFGAMDYQKNKAKILETGLGILEYDGGISYHGKCMTIDDRLSAVGSFNFDMRSTYIDTETMLIIDSEEVNDDLKLKMNHYEKEALKVVDEVSVSMDESHKMQDIGLLKQIELYIMQLLLGWLRFLM